MTQTITATFEDGVLKPAQPLDLPERAQVRLIVQFLAEDQRKKQNEETLAALEDLWKSTRIFSKEPYLTRDQLHERR
jgi:predicted DNA-binding antitoxin AbrB/MazE fold protein